MRRTAVDWRSSNFWRFSACHPESVGTASTVAELFYGCIE